MLPVCLFYHGLSMLSAWVGPNLLSVLVRATHPFLVVYSFMISNLLSVSFDLLFA